MAEIQVAISPYSKRKRPQISYYEDYSEDSDWYESHDSTAESRPNKKSKRAPKSSRPLPKRKIFPFLSLPAELRNAIYALALTEENGIYLVSKTKNYRRVVELAPSNQQPCSNYPTIWQRRGYVGFSSPEEKETPQAVPNLAIALLATNRQIYSEALPILYSNRFMLKDTTALHAFMANLNLKTRSLLETISILSWGRTQSHKALNHPGLTMLTEAVNLKRLHFNIRIAGRGEPRRVARQIYRDGFHWLEAVGSAKGKKDAAVELIEVLEGNWQRNSWTTRREGPEGRGPQHNLGAFRDELRKLLEGVTEKCSRKKKPKKPKKSVE